MSEDKRKTFSEELAEIVSQEGSIKAEEPTESQTVETEDGKDNVQVEKVEETKDESKQEPKQEPDKSEEPKPEPVQKKELPFHKHPRWLRLQKELEEAREEARLAREEATKKVEVKKDTTEAQVPAQFQKLFGEDYEAYLSWKAMLEEQTESKAKEIYSRLENERKQEAEREKQVKEQAIRFAEDQFAEISDETGNDLTNQESTERNQILDLCVKYQLFTPEGYPNIRAAFELHPHIYGKKNDLTEEKKNVLKKTSSTSVAPAPKSDVMTPDKIKEIERMGGLAYLLNK